VAHQEVQVAVEQAALAQEMAELNKSDVEQADAYRLGLQEVCGVEWRLWCRTEFGAVCCAVGPAPLGRQRGSIQPQPTVSFSIVLHATAVTRGKLHVHTPSSLPPSLLRLRTPLPAPFPRCNLCRLCWTCAASGSCGSNSSWK
jgi:hypothetical protein